VTGGAEGPSAGIVTPTSFDYDLMGARHDYPTWEGPPRRSVVLCTHPRSGSTLLGEAIHQAGGAGMPLEYFHLGFRPRFEQRWGTRALDDYIGAVHRFRTDPAGVFGVKFFWRDLEELAHERDGGPRHDVPRPPPDRLDAADYRRLFAKIEAAIPNPVFVHLRRQDRLRQAVSARIAGQTGRWRRVEGAPLAPSKAESSYDYEQLAALMSYSKACHAHWSALFAAIGVTPYEITYEQLSRDYVATTRGVLQRIGARSDDVPAPRLSQQSDSGSEAMAVRFLLERASRSGAGRATPP
jgi:LPS sulfotransferase NodH